MISPRQTRRSNDAHKVVSRNRGSQGRTTRQTFDDAGQKWNWANSNYMYATFNVSSEDYDRFNAFMMQEMEKAKTQKKD